MWPFPKKNKGVTSKRAEVPAAAMPADVPLTARLMAYLQPVRDLVPEAKLRYEGDVRPLLQQLVRVFVDQFRKFEANECQDIAIQEQELRQAMQLYSPANVVSEFKAGLVKLLDDFRNNLSRDFLTREVMLVDQVSENYQLQQQHTALVQQIRRQVVGMAGNANVVIRHVHRKLRAYVTGATSVGMGLLEALTGYDMFRWAGNSTVAAACSFIVVLVLVGSGYIAGTNWALIIAHRDAMKHFDRVHGRGGNLSLSVDGAGQLEVYPLSSSVVLAAKCSLGLFAFTLFGLLIGRAIIVYGDPQELGSKAMMGTIALCVVAILLLIFEFWTAPKYDAGHQAEWERLDSQRQQIEDQIDQLPDIQSVQDIIDDQKLNYDSAVDALAKELNARQSNFERAKPWLLDKFVQYQQAWHDADMNWRLLIQELFNAIYDVPGNPHPRPTEEDTKQFVSRFKDISPVRWDDQVFAKKLEGFQFEVALPMNARATDLDEIGVQLEEQVRTAFAARPPRTVPVRNVPQVPLASRRS